jgi:hypothetical protein
VVCEARRLSAVTAGISAQPPQAVCSTTSTRRHQKATILSAQQNTSTNRTHQPPELDIVQFFHQSTMGLIKTAMMSGAAMYGVKKLTEGRGTNFGAQAQTASPPRRDPRREYYDQDDQYAASYDPSRRQDAYPPPRRLERGQQEGGYNQGEQRQCGDVQGDTYNQGEQRYRGDIQGDYVADKRPYYAPDNPPEYSYPAAPRPQPSYAPDGSSPYRPRGFVESRESIDSQQGPSGSRGDMVNMLAQQAMSMGVLGGKNDDGRKGKGGLLGSLIGK